MKGEVLVLGAGMQGKAVLEDLEKRSGAARLVAADMDAPGLKAGLSKIGAKKTVPRSFDAGDGEALGSILREGWDAVVAMRPITFAEPAARAAIEAGVHLINTNYAHQLRGLDARAR